MAAVAREARTTRIKRSLKEPEADDGWESNKSDSDEDVQPSDVGTARKRKAAATPKGAQPRADGAALSSGKKRAKKAPADLHELQLFDIVLQHPGSIPRAAKEWVARYRADRDEATAELLTLLVKATGSLDEVTAEDVAAGEVDEVVQGLALRITEESGIDPFAHRATARTFPDHYRAFWDAAVREAAAQEVLFDGRLPDRITNTVTALSCSPVRPFRYAGTVTAAQAVASFVGVGVGLAEARDTAQYQLEQEAKKKGKAASDRASALRRQVSSLHHRAKELEQVVGVLFQGVFAHRFRDVDERVRCEVIRAVGGWAAACPATFLADSYLKYLAWAMSDAHPGVRAAAVASIERLYQDSDNLPRLSEFTGRFRARFVELMGDVDDAVAAAGLRMLAVLVAAKQLPLSEVKGAYQLLADGDEGVRRGAAALVARLLEETGAEARAAAEREAAQEAAAKAKKGKRGAMSPGGAAADGAGASGSGSTSKEAAQLEGLLMMMGRLAVGEDVDPSAAERRASLSGGRPVRPLAARAVADLAGALADELPLLGDPQLLVGALTDEAACARRGRLGNAHLAALVAALMARAAHPQGGGRGAARPAPRAAATAASERAALHQAGSVALMGALPQLLGSFQAEPEVAAPLVRCVRSMKLELFALRQQEAAFAALLDQVSGLFARHSHDELLSEAASTLIFCTKAGPAALQEPASRVLRAACTSTAAKLAAAAAAVGRLSLADLADGAAALEEEVRAQRAGARAPAGGGAAPPALHSLLAALQRGRHLLSLGARELAGDAGMAKAVQALLQGHTAGRDLGTLLAREAVAVGQLLMVWAHAALAEEAADAIEDDEEGRNDTADAMRPPPRRGGRAAPAAAPRARGPGAAAVSDLASRRGALARALEAILEAPPPAGGAAGDGGGGAAAARREWEDLSDQAFCGLTDLVMISNCGGLAGVPGAGLAAGRVMVSRLWGHVERLLEGGEEEEDDDEDGGSDDGWDDGEDGEPRRCGGPEAAAARRAAKARLAARRAQCAALLGRLLAAGVLPREQDEWLGARLVGLLADGRHGQVQEVARGVCRELRRRRPAFLPHLYLSALKTAWEQARGGRGAARRVEDASDPEGAMGPFEDLAAAVSSMYNGFNLSVPAILSIVEGGLAYGCDAPPGRLPFLGRGLAAFTPKLPQPEAARLAGRLEASLSKAGRQHDPSDDGWRDAYAYLEGLKSRGSGAKAPRGALKPAGARSKPRSRVGFAADGGAGAPARGKTGRKPAAQRRREEEGESEDDEDEEEEEEEQEQEEAEEEAEEAQRPRGRGAAAPAAASPARRRGDSGALAAATPPSLSKRAQLRAVDTDLGPLPGTQDTQQGASGRGRRRQGQEEGAEEEGDGMEWEAGAGAGSAEQLPPARPSQRGGARGAAAARQQEEEEEEEEEEQGYDEGQYDEEEDGSEEEEGRRGGGNVLENSQGSLMVQVDDDTQDDAINVEGPPPAARGRRRRRF
ncbi:MAG: hypothetical protein J3K34DRAFT_457586 [Monoraphidium minutum]|nr:MAG: hypothetical protein J3K34DRAFT_457586 [Monoraphidium minutum]